MEVFLFTVLPTLLPVFSRREAAEQKIPVGQFLVD
jgi:hypothetical protein